MQPQRPDREDPSRLLAEALRHHGAGDLDAAEALYRRVLETEPEHPDALHLYGVAAHQRGRHQLAVERIRRARASRPRDGAMLNNLGEALRGQRQFAEAIECYRAALAIDAGDVNAMNNLGLAMHHTHRFEDAERAFRQALERTPDDPDILTNLGNLLRDRDALSDALACYDEALSRAPTFAPAHAWRGVTLYELGRGDEAVAALERATDLAPLDIEAHNNLKRVRWNLDQVDRMHDSFRRASERLPQVPDAHLNLAESLALSERFADALPAVERALALDPDSARAHSLLGRVQLGLGRLEASAEAHERAVALDPEDPLLREEYASTLIAARRHERSVDVLRAGHRVAPRRSGILARLVIALAELGDRRLDALVDYERFVHARPIEVPEGFPDLASFNAALHAELEQQHLTPNHALEQTMRGGTQTLNNLFQNPRGLVAVLERQLRAVIDEFIASLPDDPSHPFLRYRNPDYTFTGAWSTILSEAGFDGSHIHNEGWLSGTYYVQVPALDARQHAAREGYIQFGEPPPIFASERNSIRRAVAPEPGLAVLFPSYYWHGVRPFHAGGARHSVSFDLV